MAYIGKQPTIGNFQKCDAISVVNGQAAYTLQVGGSNVSPESANHCLVSLNGILQAPTDSYTISGSTLTFASNLATGDVIDFVMILGNVLDLGVPSDNTVSLAKLTATGTKDATTFLRGDNTFAEAGGGIEVAGIFRLTTTFQGDAIPITSNLEEVDTNNYSRIGTAITLSSGIFSFPSTGIYLISAQGSFQTASGQSDNYHTLQIKTTTNNSTYSIASVGWSGGIDSTEYAGTFTQCMFDVTDTSTHKVQFAVDSNNANTFVLGNTNETYTGFTFIRLGDT